MRFHCLTICFIISIATYGQQTTLTGKVRDSLAGIDLAEATVVALNARDSILVDYTYTNREGNFEFKLIPGNYLLMVSYPTYADYVSPFNVDHQQNTNDRMTIHLSKKSNLLEEVVVNAKPMALIVKGDTIEYNANAYEIAPHAKVEELLKQLPGIEVDYNGQIKAYGQDVKRIYVDGEEFFGDDPTLVTRNLRGDMVDKVQLYDKKSDLAELTGVDIGEKEKTINIKLKEDKKRGVFGKVDAGMGTDRYYQGQGMFNKFTKNSKLAFYGNAATTGLVDLQSSDRSKYGVTGGTIEFVNGNITRMGVKYDELSTNSGKYEGTGEPRALSGGVHYNGKWDHDRQRINTNFKTGNLAVSGEQRTLSQNILPETALISNSGEQFRNTIFRNRVDASYEYEPDTLTKIKFSVEGLKRRIHRKSDYQVTIRNESESLISESNRSLNNKGNEGLFDFSGVYSRKLNDNGRSITFNIGSSYSGSAYDGFMGATNVFMTGPDNRKLEVIDQSTTNDLQQRVYTGTATYTDRIAKGLTAIVAYGIGTSADKTDRKSFDNTVAGSAQSPIVDFSIDFLLKQLSNHVDVALYYQIGKHTWKAENKTALVNFKQYDRTNHKDLVRDFTIWAPKFSYTYRPRENDLLSFDYIAKNTLPSSTQLQPALINDDPLNILTGNPELRPALKHNFNLNYYFFKPKTGISLDLLSSFNLIKDPIVSSMYTDPSGITVYTPVNLPDVEISDLFVSLLLGKQIRKLDLFTGLDFKVSSDNIYGLSNDALQKRSIQRYSAGISISRHRTKYYFRLSATPFYQRNYSNLNRLRDNNGTGITGSLQFGITLPKDLELSGSGRYEYQESTEVFPLGIDVFTINAALEKKFLKSKALSVTLSVNDLLNQNQGFNRSSFGTTVTQNTYTAIQRYYLLSVAWDFAKFGTNLQ